MAVTVPEVQERVEVIEAARVAPNLSSSYVASLETELTDEVLRSIAYGKLRGDDARKAAELTLRARP